MLDEREQRIAPRRGIAEFRRSLADRLQQAWDHTLRRFLREAGKPARTFPGKWCKGSVPDRARTWTEHRHREPIERLLPRQRRQSGAAMHIPTRRQFFVRLGARPHFAPRQRSEAAVHTGAVSSRQFQPLGADRPRGWIPVRLRGLELLRPL